MASEVQRQAVAFLELEDFAFVIELEVSGIEADQARAGRGWRFELEHAPVKQVRPAHMNALGGATVAPSNRIYRKSPAKLASVSAAITMCAG
jgi:hypothetical protein